jgi:DNA polymerase-4
MQHVHGRKILHIDMNAFYCSCHAAADPVKYKGKPTAVAGSPETRHGVLVTASYEARQHGIRATMTVQEALRMYPKLILIHPDFDLYRAYSKQVFKIIGEYTPQIEIFSIDECWADVTNSHQFGSPYEIATLIRARLQDELQLPCSIGVASNKFLSKMASDMKKPMGITELSDVQIPTVLWPLPVTTMFGVGAKTGDKLNQMLIHSIGDLAGSAPEKLFRVFGKRGLELIQRAKGIDDSPVQSEREPLKSVGHSITLANDVDSVSELHTILLNLSDQVGRRLRKHQLVGRTIQISIRYANRVTVTRARTGAEWTDLTEDIFATAKALLKEHRDPNKKVRLLGVSITGLQPKQAEQSVSVQLNLFTEDIPVLAKQRDRKKLQQLTEVTDRLRDKYGEDIVLRGRMLSDHSSGGIRNHKIRGTSLQKDNLDKD